MFEEANPIKSVETTIRVLHTLRERDGARVTELAESLGIAPSTAYNHLATLYEEEFVVKEGDIYYPSMEFAKFAVYSSERKKGYVLARAKVDKLTEETGGRVHFVIEEHRKGRYMFTRTGETAIETANRPGDQSPLHATASGKAILSQMPRDRVEKIIEKEGLPKFTSNTITAKRELLEELDNINENGFAVNREEHVNGFRAVASAILEPSENILGALTVSGPAQRLTDAVIENELSSVVLATAKELELELKYS